MNIWRGTVAEVNRIVNHPDIRPWAGPGPEILDFGPLVNDQRNIALIGEHGAILLRLLQQGIYDLHIGVLKSGRGKWTRNFLWAVLDYLFTHTEAVEVTAMVPRGNKAVHALVRMVHAQFEFRQGPYAIYSMPIQQWLRESPGLVDVGRDMTRRLRRDLRQQHSSVVRLADDSRDRHMGAVIEMIRAGQLEKAIVFYSRWAVLTDHPPAIVLTPDPLTIEIDGGILVFRQGNYWVIPCPPQ